MTRRVIPTRSGMPQAGHRRLGLVLVVALLALAADPSLAPGQTNNWTNALSSTWNLGTNWSGGVPTSSSDVAINNNVNVNLDTSSTINSLTFGNTTIRILGSTSDTNTTAAFTLTINDGLTHSNNSSGTFVRIQTLALGGNQSWNLNGTSGLTSASSSGFTLARQNSTTTRNTLDLAGHTLTKTGSGQLSLGNMSVGNGSISIDEGSVRFSTGIMSASTDISMQVNGTGTMTVKGGAAMMFSVASNSGSAGSFDVTKAIRMEGTSSTPSILQYTGVTGANTGPNSPVIASPIEWAGVTNAISYWVSDTGITGTTKPWTFSGNWTGSGTVNLVTDKAAGTQTAGRITVFSGSNGGFSGLVDNQQADGLSTVRFGSANSGSASAEWRLSNASATYQLNGFSVALGALSGTAGTLSNGSASAATATLGGKEISTSFGGTIANGSTGTLAIVKTGSGTQTFTGSSNNYTGGTTINGGTLVAGHANALGTSGTITVESGGTLGVGDGVTFTRAFTLNAGGRVRTGDGSTVSLPSVAALAAWESQSGSGDETVARILYGSGSTTPTALSSAWTANPGGYFSDILTLDGTGTGNVYVLSMAYDAPSAAGLNIASRESELGTFAPLGTSFQGTVPWSGGYTTVGQYGVDTTAGTVWVVTDSNSQFVVVPEPDAVAVAALAALAAAGLARRRRTA